MPNGTGQKLTVAIYGHQPALVLGLAPFEAHNYGLVHAATLVSFFFQGMARDASAR